MVVPLSAVVSRTGITVLVALRAEVMFLAMREREEGRSDLHLAPGLGRWRVSDVICDVAGAFLFGRLDDYQLTGSYIALYRAVRSVVGRLERYHMPFWPFRGPLLLG